MANNYLISWNHFFDWIIDVTSINSNINLGVQFTAKAVVVKTPPGVTG